MHKHTLLKLLVAVLALGVAQPSLHAQSASATITIRDLTSVYLEVDGEDVPTEGLRYEASIPFLPQSIRLRQWHAWRATLTDAQGKTVFVSAGEDFGDPAWVSVPLAGLTAPLTLLVEREE